jgi:DNA-binding NarL/FixJ family response regulator
VLVVEDYKPLRSFLCSTLRNQPELRIVGEISDGLEAVQQAQKLQPDLILLDIGLPGLNGIETARRIRTLSPLSRILFVSQEASTDVVHGALATGACGYLAKRDINSELLSALRAVLRGEQFVSSSLSGYDRTDHTDEQTDDHSHHRIVASFPKHDLKVVHHHEVGFYSDDQRFLDDITEFIAPALKTGQAAIVLATEQHRDSLRSRLKALGLDVAGAMEQGRYVALDAAEALSAFVVKGMPDPIRFLELVGDLIVTATEAARGEHPRVSIFGECVHLLWAQGNAEAAIRMEKLGNQLTKIHGVDILCGYSLGGVQNEMDSHTFERICAEHTAIRAEMG